MLWILKSGTWLMLLLLLFELLPTGEALFRRRRRRRRRSPPPIPCPTCAAANPPLDSNPERLAGHGPNVCSFPTSRTELYCKPHGCGHIQATRTQHYSILKCCAGFSKAGDSCPNRIPCGSAPLVRDGSYTPSRSSYAVGSVVTYSCNEYYTLVGAKQITCQHGPRWSPGAPKCNPIPCENPKIPPNAAVQGKQSSYPVGTRIQMVCNGGYRLTSGDSYKTCLLGRRWTGADITCKPVCFGSVDTCKNGGVCTNPDFCSNCKLGFHSPKCDPCPKITNCHLSICSYPNPSSSVTCKTCILDFGPERGRAYEPRSDGKKCLKRCSWRSDSNLCYPGTCGLLETCQCAPGFGSIATQCNKITEQPKIVPGFIRVYYGAALAGQNALVNITDAMTSGNSVFSNAEQIEKFVIEIAVNYLKTLPESPGFIRLSSVGLKKFELYFKFLHSAGTQNLLVLNPSMREASGLFKKLYKVDEEVDFISKCPRKPCTLHSNDKFQFSTNTENGGFLVVRNPETNSESTKVITGLESHRQLDIRIDRDRPEHCSKSSVCTPSDPLRLSAAFTTNKSLGIAWGDWTDKVSGVGDCHLTVSEMTLGADKRLEVGHGGEHIFHFEKTFSGPKGNTEVTLPSDRTRVYQVKLVVCDRVIEKLKNCQFTRRFVLCDSGTNVTITDNPLRVLQQIESAKMLWLTAGRGNVQLTWEKHFRNLDYIRNGLLNAIKPWPEHDEERFYDHLTGDRSISAIPNQLGIVNFRVQSYTTTAKDLGEAKSDAWTDLGQRLTKTFNYSDLKLEDGKSVRFFVEARDVVGHRRTDTITLHADSSPPIISNISLAGPDRPIIKVHNSKELFTARFRFEAFDHHSGLLSVKWQLKDNYTRSFLVHGESDLGNQRYLNLEACANAHDNDTCYETPMAGAFSNLFIVQLNKGKLKPGLDMTQHNHDLLFEVTVKNNAGITTQKILKISIDISGPLGGTVMDGLPGEPEVDVQNDLVVRGHWADFFDKESGILFYKYKFGTECATIREFSLADKTDETSATSTSWTAPGPGRYHLTVVAYNNALSPSAPVCSNGVTIVTKGPIISMLHIEGLRSTRGLWIAPDDRLWLLNEFRYRELVLDPSVICKKAAASKELRELGLVPERIIPHRPRRKVSLSDVECSRIGPARKDSVLPRDALLNVTFSASDDVGGIRSSELVLRTADGNVLERHNTRGHVTAAIFRPRIQHGVVFTLQLLVTNRAGLTTSATLGPVTVVVRSPETNGKLSVTRDGFNVYVRWPSSAIAKSTSPFPLNYKISVENEAGVAVLLNKAPLQFDATCPSSKRPTCTLVSFSRLGAVSNKDYVFSLYVSNVAGHSARIRSSNFRWLDFSQQGGIIQIIDPTASIHHIRTQRAISAQSSTSTLRVLCRGFRFPADAAPRATLSILAKKDNSTVTERNITLGDGSVIFGGLSLSIGESYYARIDVTTKVGNLKVETAPVWVLEDRQSFSDVTVKTGDPCDASKESCFNFQASTSHLFVTWNTPALLKNRAIRTSLVLSAGNHDGSIWSFEAGSSVEASLQTNFTFTVLSLRPGRPYRVSVTFCIDAVCSVAHNSKQIWIAATPPLPGKLTVKILSADELAIDFDPFSLLGYRGEQHSIYMDGYDYRLLGKGSSTTWQRLNDLVAKGGKLTAKVHLPAKITTTKCVDFALRGSSKANLTGIVQRKLRPCDSSADGVRPGVVIDAKGPLVLPDTFPWSKEDEDFLKEGDILSAVWPSLRHGRFQWALIESPWNYKGLLFVTESTKLRSPCDHKKSVKCGTTNKRYVNVPADVSLKADTRYHLCIHADSAVVGSGRGREVLSEVSYCSDGVTILADGGKPGQVDIGPPFQSSANLLVIKWKNFFTGSILDTILHHSVVKYYTYRIGTTPGADNIVRDTSVGLADRAVAAQLRLHNGEKYYCTVTAVNLVDVQAKKTSARVLIDLRPPQVTNVRNLRIDGSKNNFLTDVRVCTLRWDGVFADAESGVCSYQWCVGSDPKYCDIKNPQSTTSLFVTANLDSVLSDGNRYFFNVRAMDCVGHSTLLSSNAYYVIKNGPQVGVLSDGRTGIDIDHQTDTTQLSAHWTPFVDRFIDVTGYYVRIGSSHGGGDVIANVSLGLHTNVTFSHLTLRFGVHYFFTVVACNAAGLCSEAYSDGLVIDDSPPTAGRIVHGSHGENAAYQCQRRVVVFRLDGFADLESGLSSMEWCIGAKKECDVTTVVRSAYEPFVRAELPSDLPLSQNLFVYVTVFNNVGLKRNAVSRGFRVDTTPPTFSESPSIDLSQHSLNDKTQISPSVLALKWRAGDTESGVTKQFVSVAAHANAAEAAPPKELMAFDINGHKFTNLKLYDGYRYQGWVNVCNGAGLCSSAATADVLVDNSSPQVGMFLPRTNASHVHKGRREMKWQGAIVTITFRGFSDAHSGIISYEITIGSVYIANNLLKLGRVKHDDSSFEQKAVFTLSRALKVDETIFIGLRAVNGVGLKSHMLHAAFVASNDTYLDEVRRCSSVNCLGQCVCAPLHETCAPSSSCKDESGKAGRPTLAVTAATSSSGHEVTTTTEPCYLGARWIASGGSFLRYEVSAGLSAYSEPKGLFDALHERVWFDVGQDTRAVLNFTQRADKCMKTDTRYKFFVRGWLSDNAFAVFTSGDVTPIVKAPRVLRRPGTRVREVDPKRPTLDLNFVDSSITSLRVVWPSQFSAWVRGTIKNYIVGLGTFCGGGDVVAFASLPSTTTERTFSGLSLRHGQRIVASVRACDLNDLCSEACSNGVLADFTRPLSGLVLNSYSGLWNSRFQSNATHFVAAWKEFSDPDCFVSRYEVCIGRTTDTSDCSMLPWESKGLLTRVQMSLAPHKTLTHAQTVFVRVRAENQVPNSFSDVVSADPLLIDLSPPYLAGDCATLSGDHVANADFTSTSGSVVAFSSLSASWWKASRLGAPTAWQLSGEGAAAQIVSSSFSHSGDKFVLVKGSLSQVVHTTPGKPHVLIFYVSDVGNWQAKSMRQGFVHIGQTVKLSIELQGRAQDDRNIVWHRKAFYFFAVAATTMVEFGTLASDVDGLAFDSVSLLQCSAEGSASRSAANGIHIDIEQVGEESRLHATWSHHDDESDVVEVQWALGTTQYGVQYQPYLRASPLISTVQTPLLRVPHGTPLHFSLLIINGAGLARLSYGSPIIVDFTSPTIITSLSGSSCVDGCIVTSGNFFVSLHAQDKESEIRYCSYALGSERSTSDLQDFVTVKPIVGRSDVMHVMRFATPAVNGRIVYPLVLCVNGRGMTTTRNFDKGFRIVTKPPAATHAHVSIVTPSATFYPRSSARYQSQKDQVVFTWGGFIDSSGSQYNYEFAIVGPSGSKYTGNRRHLANSQGRMIILDGLDFAHSATYILKVWAVNLAGLSSSGVSTEIIIDAEKPTITRDKLIIRTKSATELQVDWSGVFSSFSPLFYEVAIGTGRGKTNVFGLIETKLTSITVKNALHSFQTYHFSVTGINSAGLFAQDFFEIKNGRVVKLVSGS